MRTRVLFVDDERAMLDGLKNRLFRQRHRWDMSFETDGACALDAMRVAPVDVIVSDLRMPGIDGGTLLATVRREQPATARIMLSGHGDRAAIVRALPELHQFLSKPCDGSTLCEVIERASALLTISDAGGLRARLGGLASLPCSAGAAAQLAALIARGEPTIPELVAIAERDPAVAAKLLQLSASTYFGTEAGATSIAQAVARVGSAQVVELVVPAVLASRIPDARVEPAWRAADLARRWLGGPAGEIAYAAALLRDCAGGVIDDPATSPRDPAASACLLELWGVPRAITEVVRWHADLARAPADVRELACAVYVADAIARGDEASLDADTLVAIGMRDRVAAWRDTAG